MAVGMEKCGQKDIKIALVGLVKDEMWGSAWQGGKADSQVAHLSKWAVSGTIYWAEEYMRVVGVASVWWLGDIQVDMFG